MSEPQESGWGICDSWISLLSAVESYASALRLPPFSRSERNSLYIPFDFGTSFRKDLNYMRASVRGREELVARVQQALALSTKKEAEMVVDTVVAALEATLLDNLDTDGFTLKLGSFGKFYVRHKPGIRRKIGFSGQTIQTKMRQTIKFVSLGAGQGSDLLLAVLRRPLAPRCKESGGCHPGWPSLGASQPPSQLVELAGEQSEGEPKDGVGNLGAFADSDDARPVHGRRPRRDDCGSGEVSRCRGIRIRERSVETVGGIVGRSFRCHVR